MMIYPQPMNEENQENEIICFARQNAYLRIVVVAKNKGGARKQGYMSTSQAIQRLSHTQTYPQNDSSSFLKNSYKLSIDQVVVGIIKTNNQTRPILFGNGNHDNIGCKSSAVCVFVCVCERERALTGKPRLCRQPRKKQKKTTA